MKMSTNIPSQKSMVPESSASLTVKAWFDRKLKNHLAYLGCTLGVVGVQIMTGTCYVTGLINLIVIIV